MWAAEAVYDQHKHLMQGYANQHILVGKGLHTLEREARHLLGNWVSVAMRGVHVAFQALMLHLGSRLLLLLLSRILLLPARLLLIVHRGIQSR